jgi:hypothetical protein
VQSVLSQAALAVLSALALTLAGAAFGNPVTSSVRINAGPLSSSL